tara:strand:+ start:296 stop:529 length:234 start_codon:yes stop_codon:yes gene_type:complete
MAKFPNAPIKARARQHGVTVEDVYHKLSRPHTVNDLCLRLKASDSTIRMRLKDLIGAGLVAMNRHDGLACYSKAMIK